MAPADSASAKTTGARTRVAQRTNPIEVYEVFMRQAIGRLFPGHAVTPESAPEFERRIRTLLYRELLKPPFRPEVEALLSDIQLSAGWVRNHLLTIGTWSPRVREAVRQGLPLKDGAAVARIRRKILKDPGSFVALQPPELIERYSRSEGDRLSILDEVIDHYERAVLKPFDDAQQLPIHLRPRESEVTANIGYEVNSIVKGLKVNGAEQHSQWITPQQTVLLTGGRRLPLTSRARPVSRPLWLYDALPPEQVANESLHPVVARAIVATYGPTSPGYVLDPMAGSGAVAQAALNFGHQVWAGDLSPSNDMINIHDVLSPERLVHGQADLLVLHPPTFETWQSGWNEVRTPAEYLAFVRSVLDTHSVLVGSHGRVVLIVQPFTDGTNDVRDVLTIAAPTSHPRAVALHQAVARDGEQSWHVLVFAG